MTLRHRARRRRDFSPRGHEVAERARPKPGLCLSCGARLDFDDLPHVCDPNRVERRHRLD